MDGSTDAFLKLSLAKAKTCTHLKMPSRQFREKYTGNAGDAGKFTQAAAMVGVL